MKYKIIYGLFMAMGVLLLSGCIQTNHIKNSNILHIGMLGSGGIIHTPILTTGTILIYHDNSMYEIFKNAPGCFNDTSNTAGALAVRCEGLVGYDHLYQIPAMKLEYLYESERLSPYDENGAEIFLFATGGKLPLTKDNIFLFSKNQNDTPLEVVQSHISQGCDIATGWLENYDSYLVWLLRDYNVDDFNNISNGCVPNFPMDLGNDSWLYIFSNEHPDYYYILGTNATAGNGPQLYTSKSLKLFVE